jgi:hypothetical protein
MSSFPAPKHWHDSREVGLIAREKGASAQHDGGVVRITASQPASINNSSLPRPAKLPL